MKFRIILKNDRFYNSLEEINGESNPCELCDAIECQSCNANSGFCFVGINKIILESSD